jgi:serine/threonine protein kinase
MRNVSYEVMRVQDRTPERLGPYRVIKRLGEGGMGVVYLATDAAGQSVAVKALHPGMAQEENARRRLGREVETMHRVRSPFVAQVLGADLDGDPPYIVTRYVPGLTLDAVIASGGALSGGALKRLAYGLAQALAAVHAAGVVHRDLKPGNVMISDGEPVVIDFGIAQLAETTRLTLTGMFMGTPGYLAPEVIEGKDSGPASDVHSWAATLAFAATGRPPFGTGSFEAIFFRIMHGPADLDTLPLPLRSMVRRALARDPATRPSAAELVQWAAALDATALVPSLAGLDGMASGSGASPRTIADQSGLSSWPTSTRPLLPLSPDDVRDLLPPVSYSTPAALPAGSGLGQTGQAVAIPGSALMPGNGASGNSAGGLSSYGLGVPPDGRPPAQQFAAQQFAGQQFAGQESGAGRSPAADARRVAAVSPWSPLVIASVLLAVVASVMAPLAGTVIALALLVALRAAAITARQLGRSTGTTRGAGQGGRPPTGAPVAKALLLFPFSVLRALIGIALLAPVALLGSCVAIAATIIAVPQHPLPQAVAFGAGTLVAIVGLGPGSAGSRSVLASIYSSAARTPGSLAVTYLGVLSVLTWAAIAAWYQSPAPTYWPVIGLHAQLEHLPSVRTALTDFRLSLLRLARQLIP